MTLDSSAPYDCDGCVRYNRSAYYTSPPPLHRHPQVLCISFVQINFVHNFVPHPPPCGVCVFAGNRRATCHDFVPFSAFHINCVSWVVLLWISGLRLYTCHSLLGDQGPSGEEAKKSHTHADSGVEDSNSWSRSRRKHALENYIYIIAFYCFGRYGVGSLCPCCCCVSPTFKLFSFDVAISIRIDKG